MESTLSQKSTKIIVDIFMLFFLLLSIIHWDGNPTFHIIVGIGCVLFFTLHISIHRKWISSVTNSYLAGKIPPKVKGKYAVVVLLLLVWGIAILTSLPALATFLSGKGSAFGSVHEKAAELGLVLVFIHVFQQRGKIKSYFKKPVSRQTGPLRGNFAALPTSGKRPEPPRPAWR
jgi:hypothetical protein